MLLIYILIAMLPELPLVGKSDACSSAEIAGLLMPAVQSILSGQFQNSMLLSSLADLVTSITSHESFLIIMVFGALSFVVLVAAYLIAKRRSRQWTFDRQRSRDGEATSPGADAGDSLLSDSDTTTFSPTYASTESAPAILIAEDDDEVRIFITNTLRINYRVIAVRDGLKAFRKAFETVPDLVITNSRMPGMDGVSLCHLIKATMATSHIPVIILNTEREIHSEGPVPADGCIRPDFDAKSLLIEIKHFIHQRRHLYSGFRKQLFSGLPVDDYFSSETAFIHRVNGILKNGFHRSGFGVDDLMDGLSLTKLQLYRKLKVLTNKTPGEYIRSFRVNEAKRLMQNRNSHLHDVAVQTGFSNLSGFSKAFKEVTGVSPVEFSVHSPSLTNPVGDQ